MQGMSAIIAAMMSQKPQVTPMGAAPQGGRGGRVPAVRGGGGSMSASRGAQPSPRAPLELPSLSPMSSGGQPQQSPVGAGNTNPMTGGALPQGGAPNPDRLLKQVVDADNELRALENPQNIKDAWRAREELPKARERLVWAQKNVQDYQQAQAMQANKVNAAQVFQTAVPIVGQQQAQQMADFAYNNPKEYPMIMEQLLGTAENMRAEDVEIGENIRKEQAGYTREDEKEDWDSAEMANALFNSYPDVNKGVISALVQTDSSFTDLSNWLDKRAENAKEDRTEGARIMRAIADSEFETDSAIRQIGKTLGLSDEFGTTGFLGAFIKRVPGTDAYMLDKSIDVQKAKMAFTELLEMRRQSETGGALGNVSNREIELLYSAFTALDQGLGKQEFQSNMTDVLQRFERVKFMLANEEAMGEAKMTPQEMNEAANRYTSMQVAQQMGTHPDDVQYLFDNPDTAAAFEESEGWRPIQIQLDKGHLYGWKE